MENLKKTIHSYSKQELYDELHERTSKVIKSVTPKYDITWWVKWASSIVIICAIILRSLGLYHEVDVLLSFIGCLGWLFVAIRWQDRSLIILNTIAATVLLLGMVKEMII